ncbi:hypothetical protein HYH02_004008 [Chlamydomonas schloesseri]|uniref:Uncharacterized protein n=1 Tax=Chlamydomonas schloesseri TaxID=2026947 RepID=A0A835WP31_9CHLO|nr:hypothetical protein HYH02_004008 [Chlamydomonas schloesseri]|eukprot:KAG2451408.1 hypothetical protein HYH02_004008 [Chlamydomonas schloesseri]
MGADVASTSGRQGPERPLQPAQQQARGAPSHTTTTFAPKDFPHPKRPLGDPPVTELNPTTSSQNIRLKHRASTLIQKYAGSRWREAQRTKWLIDIVCHIDKDYREYIMEQAAEIETLHQQLERTNGLQATAAQSVQLQNAQLRQRVDELEQQLRAAQGAVLDMQNRVAASEMVLNEAEEAARAAAEECLQLQQAVAVLAEHDAAARKQLANRAHVMRDALVASRCRVRQAAEHSRKHRVEVAAVLTLAAQRAEQDRNALAAQLTSSMAAASTLQRAAAQLEVQQLQLELGAYKEPWRYMFRGKSPVKDPETSRHLGLKPGSMNVAIPF